MPNSTRTPVRSRGSCAPSRVPTRLKPERVQDGLRALPNWRRSRDGRYLVRTFKFTGEGAPLAFAGLVLAMAAQQGHAPTVTLYQGTVVCKLTTPEAHGITARDLDMARRISFLS